MIQIFGRKKTKKSSQQPDSALQIGLKKTRNTFRDRLARVFLGRKLLDQSALDELEVVLLSADVGIQATEEIIAEIKQKVGQTTGDSAVTDVIREKMVALLRDWNQDTKPVVSGNPKAILLVGINGVGKTTSVAKLARFYLRQNQTVMLAAGDTYRAAAIEQLETWAQRLEVPLIAQQQGSDSAAVVYDALSSAKAKGMNILIADTAGRLHTQDNLMKELEKVKRVLKKLDPTAPHEVLMVLDATTGQSALAQVATFVEVLGIDGIILTKLDGTAKGGVIFPILHQLSVPVRYVGTGETFDDFAVFDPQQFVDALFD